MLKIAIQTKGRLHDKSIEILGDSGINIPAASRTLITRATGFPLEVLFLRDDDIPQAVAMGLADLGIVGLNEVAESGEKVDTVMTLGFGGCRISLAIPKDIEYRGIEWFNGKSVATSYPSILRKFFNEKGINAKIQKISGSVEVAPAIGMTDAIFDIVSSGGTLVQNGLIEVERVFESEAVLIANCNLPEDKLKDIEKLKLRFHSIINSRGMKYVLMNIPKEALEEAKILLPGMKSPTIIPLERGDWYAIQVVIHEDELWDKIEELKKIGAEDILVLSMENIIR